jgi:hypothetical protein
MSELSFAWDNEAEEAIERGPAARYGAWTFYAFTALLALWLFLYVGGLFTTLGSAQGSERHGASAIRIADEGGFGVPTMYLTAGQKAWWHYDVRVEGEGGVRLVIAKSVPSPRFIARARNIRASERGRFEIVAPEGGFYTFSREWAPIGRPLVGARPGSTA